MLNFPGNIFQNTSIGSFTRRWTPYFPAKKERPKRALCLSTKRAHFCGDAGRGGKPLPMPSAAAACTPPGAAASRFRYHVPPVRFAHRNMMFPSLQGCSQPCSERPSTCRRSEALRSKVSLRVSPAAPPGAGETCPGGKGRQRRPFPTS